MPTRRSSAKVAFRTSDAVHGDSPDGIDSALRRCGRWVSVEDGRVVVDGKRIATLDVDVIAWDADEHRVVVAADIGNHGGLVEVAIPSGKTREVFRQQIHANGAMRLASVALGANGELVTGSGYHLMLIGSDGAIAHELKENALWTWRVGSVFIVEHYKRNKVVYRIAGGKLKRGETLARKDSFYVVWSDRGRWFAELDDVVEITGV